jgi:hypothetical protein
MLLLSGVVNVCLRGLCGSLVMRPQCHLVRLIGMLKSLPGEFMARQVILFSIVLRGGTVSVRGKVVKFSSSPM